MGQFVVWSSLDIVGL